MNMKRIITALLLFPLLAAGQTKFSQLPAAAPDGYTSFVGLKNASGIYTDYLFSLSALTAYLESSSGIGLNSVLGVNPNSSRNIYLGVDTGTNPYSEFLAGINPDGTGTLTLADTTGNNTISLTTNIGQYPQIFMTNVANSSISLNTNGTTYDGPEIDLNDSTGAYTNITSSGGIKTTGRLTMSNVTLQPLITSSGTPTVYIQQQAGTLPVTVAKADLSVLSATTNILTYAATTVTTLQASCYVTVTNYVTGNVQAVILWTDENGTAQQISSAVITAVGRYNITTQPIRVGAGTVTVKLTFSGSSVIRCDAGAWLIQ